MYENLPVENPNDPELQVLRQYLLQLEQTEHQNPAQFQASLAQLHAKGVREPSVAQKQRIYSVGTQKAAGEDSGLYAILANNDAIFDQEELEAVGGGGGGVGTGVVSSGSR